MIDCPTVEKCAIRGHYDLSTLFYRLLWGPHIHHGLWDADESPRLAQLRLTEGLAALAGIAGGETLLDVGCGMGGSSIHLARRYGCRATGVTISPVQRQWAAASSRWHGVARQTDFRCADAEQVEFADGTFDVVWSIECTEHLFDKPRFFRRAASWLKPGGTMAICAWLAGDGLAADPVTVATPARVTLARDPLADDARRRQVYEVCEGFLCPSLGTMADYTSWMESAGLVVETAQDWTARVTRTWEICRDRVRRSKVRWLARMIDRDSVLFLDRFDAILDAYRSGAMEYGSIVARKPR